MSVAIAFLIDEPSVERSVHVLEQALDRQVGAALDLIGEKVAEEARANHPYQNRTGDLEGSTQSQPATGSFMTGSAEVDVIAWEDYAEYVDSRPEFAFLEPAFERTESIRDRMLQNAVDEATRLAGW